MSTQTKIEIPLPDLLGLLKLDQAILKGVPVSRELGLSLQTLDPSRFTFDGASIWFTKNYKALGSRLEAEKARQIEERRKWNLVKEVREEVAKILALTYSLKTEDATLMADVFVRSKNIEKIRVLGISIKPEWQEIFVK